MRLRLTGSVLEVLDEREGAVLVSVEADGIVRRAWNLPSLTGPVEVGDKVLLNTVAVELGLGTGGVDFVVANLRNRQAEGEVAGHIMKLRYTPLQLPVLAVEAPESDSHRLLKEVSSVDGMPVIACGLHSQLAPVCATLKALDPSVRVAYVMTDAGALPIAISNLVRELKSKDVVDLTITAGNSFGGDYETVNVHSALAAAKTVGAADVAVVAMGPGIVGTGTSLGHTGVDQGLSLNAATSLGGRAIAAPRISFGDVRRRHQGVSHHTLTALGLVTLARCTVVVASMRGNHGELVASQLQEAGVFSKHHVVTVENDVTLKALEDFDLHPTTMGRTVEQEPEFFTTAGASAIWAMREQRK